MHIGFLTLEYPPLPGGGIGTSMRNLARALVAAGHRVTVIGWGAEERFEDRFDGDSGAGRVAVRFLGDTRLPKSGWLLNRRRAAHALRALVREHELTIVESHDWCGPSAGIRLPCPIVVRCHGSATYFGDLLDESVRPSVRWAETLALRGATDVVAVSRFTAERTRALFGLERAIGTIHNGIDPTLFSPADPGSTANPVEADTALYFGTLVRKKGVLDLATAFSRVADARPDARLRLIGRDDPDKKSGAPSTWALCRDLLSPRALARVAYDGAVPYARMQEEIRRAAVCVFPSFAEAMPLAWLEAMACARPVVAYDVGWAREVIADGEDGVLVPAGDVAGLADAIAGLLADPARAAALGRAARRTVERRFSAATVAERTVEWYREVLASCR